MKPTIWMANPNGTSRRRAIDKIVIHSMGEFVPFEGRVRYAADFLVAAGLSAHALITPSGDVIRTRADERVAWHARGNNASSLGVELLVPGQHDIASLRRATSEEWVSDAQYTAAVELVSSWMRTHGIEKVVRHSDLDEAKFDPGDGFPWETFLVDLF